MRRALFTLLTALTLGVVVPAHLALAHGPALKGVMVERSGNYVLETGECACEQRWFTLGLKPGTVQISLTMKKAGDPLASDYAINFALLQGQIQEGAGRIVCATKSRCGKSATVTFRVKTRGVYYVFIQGQAAHNIPFVIRIRGNVYHLNCRSYC